MKLGGNFCRMNRQDLQILHSSLGSFLKHSAEMKTSLSIIQHKSCDDFYFVTTFSSIGSQFIILLLK